MTTTDGRSLRSLDAFDVHSVLDPHKDTIPRDYSHVFSIDEEDRCTVGHDHNFTVVLTFPSSPGYYIRLTSSDSRLVTSDVGTVSRDGIHNLEGKIFRVHTIRNALLDHNRTRNSLHFQGQIYSYLNNSPFERDNTTRDTKKGSKRRCCLSWLYPW